MAKKPNAPIPSGTEASLEKRSMTSVLIATHCGCLISGPACSILPLTSSVFTSDF
jgi:hypothetical protein